MLKLRDFQCENCTTTEESLEEDSVESIICPHCGQKAVRVLSSFATWDSSPAATRKKLEKRSRAHSLSKQGVEEARHQYDKAVGKIQTKLHG